MKKVGTLVTTILLVFIVFMLNAQNSTTEFFEGKWKVKVLGTPNGDSELTMTITSKDGKLEGTIVQVEKDTITFNRVEFESNNIIVYWNSTGYDVFLKLKKIDKDRLEGSLVDLFEASADRIKD